MKQPPIEIVQSDTLESVEVAAAADVTWQIHADGVHGESA